MESNSLIVWLKSVCNVIVGSDSTSYFTLAPNDTKTGLVMDNSDRNNNQLCNSSTSDASKAGAALESKGANTPGTDVHNSNVAHQTDDDNTSHESDSSNSILDQTKSSYELNTTNSEQSPEKKMNGHVTTNCEHTGDASPCCDIIKYKNKLCHDLRSSPINSELKSGRTVKSSKIIEAIIEVIKKRQLFSRFDPFESSKSHNFNISPFITACMRSCTITGFSNVEKADSDGIIRYLGNNRFAIDCAIQIRDMRCEANYCIKLGQRWHKRIRLRNKSFTLKLDKCLIYVEVKINTAAKTIRFERFSPISQQNVRCKTKPFAIGSLDHLLCKMMQRYFEKFFAANVLKLESQARRYLDRSALLKYDDIVECTALHKMFEYFPGIPAVPVVAVSRATPDSK